MLDHKSRICPSCGLDVSHTGLVKLVYSFEVCYCQNDEFGHLVETAWHRECFVSAKGQKAISREVIGLSPP